MNLEGQLHEGLNQFLPSYFHSVRSYHIVPAQTAPYTSAEETSNVVSFATELESFIRAVHRRMSKCMETLLSYPIRFWPKEIK